MRAAAGRGLPALPSLPPRLADDRIPTDRVMPKDEPGRAPKTPRRKRLLPRSFKELTPSRHFNPRTFFYELVWKALLTRRTGEHVRPKFPKLARGQAALTWIGHASFLAQFTDLNVLIDPEFRQLAFSLEAHPARRAEDPGPASH